MRNYLLTQRYTAPRGADKLYTAQQKIADRWEPIAEFGGGCGNLTMCLGFKKHKTRIQARFFETGNYWEAQHEGLYTAISSADLLYRLMCLWQLRVDCNGPEGYKCLWSTFIRHKETGEVIGFGEHKGGATMWSNIYHPSKLPPSLYKDLLDLMNLLVSRNLLHPYDGTRAGTVA